MALEKALESLSEGDLQELITNGISERRTIEYKRTLPGQTDDEKKEFLADVSSFANAAGGHLIYGMRETGGLPDALVGMQVADANAEKLRLESMIRDGIAPRISGVGISEPITVSGGVAFVLRVPRSWLSPHMVTFKAHSKFYSRNSAGKYPLNVEELRTAFAFSEATRERLRNFRADRISKIVAGLAPVSLASGPVVVLHVVPLSAFEFARRFDAFALAQLDSPRFTLQPIYATSAYNSRYNFDGYLIYEQMHPEQPAWSYLQMFRDGSIESVSASILKSRKRIPSLPFEGKLLHHSLPQYIAALKKLGAYPPLFVGISLLGVTGYLMGLPVSQFFFFDEASSQTIDRDSIIVPEITVETFGSNLDEAIKPAFDSIWNAAGRAESIYYEGSEWKGEAKFIPKRP
jgi:hypothetical protein